MLLDDCVSDEFLSKYKAVIAYLNNGVYPDGSEGYAALRGEIFIHLDEIQEDLVDVVGMDFIDSLRAGVFGAFIFLKRYQRGYVLQHIDTGVFYQAACLNTPLDSLVDEYSVITTALIPYANGLVCDGLVLSHQTLLGKNMAKEARDGYWAAKRSGHLITSIF